MVTIGGRAHTIEEIHAVGKLGYPFAEINVDDPEQIAENLSLYNDLKSRYGLYYLGHYPNEGNPNDLDNLRRNYMPKIKKLIILSRKLDIEKATIHFWMDKRWADKAILDAKIEMLAEMVAYAGSYGVTLCLENLSARHDSFSNYFAAIPDLRMTLDIGHGELLSKNNTSFGFMEHVLPKIVHVHVHDNMGGNSPRDDLHLALGNGKVDYPKILTVLRQKGYDSTITMEVKPHDMPRTLEELKKYI